MGILNTTRIGLLGREKTLVPRSKHDVRLRGAVGSLLICVGVVRTPFRLHQAAIEICFLIKTDERSRGAERFNNDTVIPTS